MRLMVTLGVRLRVRVGVRVGVRVRVIPGTQPCTAPLFITPRSTTSLTGLGSSSEASCAARVRVRVRARARVVATPIPTPTRYPLTLSRPTCAATLLSRESQQVPSPAASSSSGRCSVRLPACARYQSLSSSSMLHAAVATATVR